MPPSSLRVPDPIVKAANCALAAVPVTRSGTAAGRPIARPKVTGTEVERPTRTAFAGLPPALNRPPGATPLVLAS